MSIYNDLTGLRWLHKCFRIHGRHGCLGPESWATVDRSQCGEVELDCAFVSLFVSVSPSMLAGCAQAAWILRIRTCDPCLKRVANPITNNNLHVQLTPCTTQ